MFKHFNPELKRFNPEIHHSAKIVENGPRLNTMSIMAYLGSTWLIRWMTHRNKYIFDVTFHNPKDAIFFTLRWK